MIDAAVTAPNAKIYFFSGDQYMRYDFENGRADRGYPKPISTWDGLWPKDIDAAVPGQGDRAHKLYFFKGSQYMRYDTKKGRVDTGYPKPISGAWRGLWDRDIDAAVTAPNKKMYFLGFRPYSILAKPALHREHGERRAMSGFRPLP